MESLKNLKMVFDGIKVIFIRLDSADPIFKDVGNPLSLISTDGGLSWTGMSKSRCRTTTLEIWAKIYYCSLISGIAFDPKESYFDHDIRRVAFYSPGKDRWVLENIFSVDDRGLNNIKDSFAIFKGDNKPPEKTIIKPPPLPPRFPRVSYFTKISDLKEIMKKELAPAHESDSTSTRRSVRILDKRKFDEDENDPKKKQKKE